MRNFILVLVALFSLQLCYAQEVAFMLVVHDKITREPIAGAQVKLQELASLREFQMSSNESGLANFMLLPGSRYRLEVSKKNDASGTGYLSYTYILSDKDIAAKKVFEAELEKVKHSDAGLLPALHFDYHKAGLNSENLATLNNAATMLLQFPSMQIQIGIYADCREDVELISKRAAAITAHMAAKGVEKRVIIKEFGNVRSLNQCNCSNKNFVCPEDKYTENRRAEFKVIAF